MFQFAYEKFSYSSLSFSDETPGSVISVSNVEISGQSSTRERQKTWWLKQEATHSHWSCLDWAPTEKPSVPLVPHRPTPPLLLPLLVHSSFHSKSPSPSHVHVCLHSLHFCFCCAQRLPPLAPASFKQSNASHALVPSCSLSAHILSSQTPSFPLCSLWSAPLSQLQKALLGSLSSQGTSVSRVVIPAGEFWRGRGVCS